MSIFFPTVTNDGLNIWGKKKVTRCEGQETSRKIQLKMILRKIIEGQNKLKDNQLEDKTKLGREIVNCN